MPCSYWRYPQLEARSDAEILAQTLGEKSEPLIVSRQMGLGRALYIGLDDLWRWKSADDEYPGRFWNNVLRWAISGGLAAREKHLGIAINKHRCGIGEELLLGAQVNDDDGYGVENDALEATIFLLDAVSPTVNKINDATEKSSGAPIARIRLEPTFAPGLYRATINNLAEGRYEIRAQSALYKIESEKLPPLRISIGRDPFLEHLEMTLNRPLLEEIAEEGGGQYFSLDRIEKIVKNLPEGVSRETTRRIGRSLWNNFVYFALLISLLTAEWIFRKWRGLL